MLGWLGAGMLAPVLSGCATSQSRMSGITDTGGEAGDSGLELLYFADTLDSRSPTPLSLPDIHLGPAARLGSPPWITGPMARDVYAAQGLDGLSGHASVGEYGGYAQLAALLGMLRQRSPQALTLENGQCWNGSGLAYLTRGGSGVEGSRLLSSDVRVSSDERVLWPQRAAELYRQSGVPVLGASLPPERREPLGIEAWSLFERSGVKIAVVGATDPYAADEQRSLTEWFDTLRQSLQQARAQADLVVLLADVGTGPAIWLAEHLEGVDLLLAARGQDLWPQLIRLRDFEGKPVQLCLPGCRGIGVFAIRCRGAAGRWSFTAEFHPAVESGLDAAALARLPELRRGLDQQRAIHAAWLDQPLARAPEALYRRDLFGGTWDRLIHDALSADSAEGVILPGLRYDRPLVAGEWITREHLFMLTGSYEARIQALDASAETLVRLLEQRTEECLGEPLILDTSRDMPRLFTASYRLDYIDGGISDLRVENPEQTRWRTFTLRAGSEGTPLWQLVERYLRSRPEGWRLGVPTRPRVDFVEGHPGWNPQPGRYRSVADERAQG